MPVTLRQRTPVPLSTAAAVAHTLPVPPRRQEHPLWCWAACIQMTMMMPRIDTDQCGIVGNAINQRCCGVSPVPSVCVTAEVDRNEIEHAFDRNGITHERILDQHPGLLWIQVTQCIDDQKPIFGIWYFQHQPGVYTGHAVLVTGYDDNGEVRVNNPTRGERLWMTLADLNTAMGRGDLADAWAISYTFGSRT